MGDGDRKHSPNDSYPTPTSALQASTERILASHVPVNTSESDYELKKNTHVQFIARVMLQGFPSKYISQDASQPWLMFWILQSFSVLQVGLDPGNKQRSARSSSRPPEGANLSKRTTGRLTRYLPVNIRKADLAVGQGSLHIYCRHMPLCVHWLSLGDPGQAEAGTTLIGM